MKAIALLPILLLASCAPKQGYNPRHYEPIDYHATPFTTSVEWDMDFGGTVQMAFYCETIFITIERGEFGDVNVVVRSDKY